MVTSKAFNRYAFIERLEAPAKKHKNFYIDLIKSRRNGLLHLKENNIKIPVFTVMDEPKYFEVGKDKIETGFYFIESNNYFPTRQKRMVLTRSCKLLLRKEANHNEGHQI